VWSWTDGRFEDYPGGFDDWREWTARRQTEASEAAASAAAKQSAAQAAASAQPAKGSGGLSKNEQRRREAELARLEARIHEIETRVAEIESTLADPALYAAGADPARPKALADERDALATELADAYAAWEKVGEELAGV
jgi:ATPase subunit of ABC transporter with duplicated ATPase domains